MKNNSQSVGSAKGGGSGMGMSKKQGGFSAKVGKSSKRFSSASSPAASKK